ncbi:MAG: class I SAM-dependent methyltransferase, partial [Acidobacteria bacterium]|nr:class I SAM-dependent methyltransferase [Acidobacteriota bacterium]
MSATELSPEMEALKGRMKATWMAGDFGVIAKQTEQPGQEFVSRLGIGRGMKVLDVACGTGNTALPEARLGADVIGVDIADNLVEQARQRAASEGLTANFQVGDAEDLQFEDNSFDAIVTMFGAMFAPRPEVVASEFKRVCKPGGLIAMANWTPQSFPGQMFKLSTKYIPPPPGITPPVMWGDEETVRQRFSEGISDLKMQHIKVMFHFDMPPAEVVELFKTYFGPTTVAFSKLDEAGQAALHQDMVELFTSHNLATDGT